MKNIRKVCSMLLLLFLIGCSDDKDEHYERPPWLEAPIYSILKEKGNFSMYLSCVDKTLYSQALKGSGNFTVFAPNDEAFARFLSEKGYHSLDEIPEEERSKIVGYSLVYNKFESARLGDVLSANEWIPGQSIKKRTAYYKTIYKDNVHGKEAWVVDNTASNVTKIITPYKYIPIFTQSFFDTNGLIPTDFTTFYPEQSFDQVNIPGGNVVQKDMYAENGVVHEVNVVPYPLENLDEILAKEENSSLKALMDYQIEDAYLFMQFDENKTLTEEYRKLYPDKNIGELYVKNYLAGATATRLAFSPNIENYVGVSGITAEQDGYTLFIPNNQSVDNYINNKLLKYAHSLTELPPTVLYYFLSAHMANSMIWPSKFSGSQNANGEFFNGSGATGPSFNEAGITHKTVASNGICYYIDHVIPSRYFETVYSEIFLNPDKYIVSLALNRHLASLREDLMRSPLNGFMEENYTLLVPSNKLLEEDGFTYTEGSTVSFANALMQSSNADERIRRIVRMGIFKRIKNNEVNMEIADFKGSPSLGYDGYGYAVTDFGDMIRFKDNKLQAAGNIMENEYVEVSEIETYTNGKVFAMDKLLQYSPRNSQAGTPQGWDDRKLYLTISDYVAQNPDASMFKNYLDKTIYVATDGSLSGISSSSFYTVLIPQNDKMQEAINQGYLPPLSNVVPGDAENMAKATNFITACFLSGILVPDDGLSRIMPGNYVSYSTGTAYMVNEPSIGLISEKTTMEISKENGQLIFTPKDIVTGATLNVEGINRASVIRDIKKSNYMGSRSVIHAIDNFLAFKVNRP